MPQFVILLDEASAAIKRARAALETQAMFQGHDGHDHDGHGHGHEGHDHSDGSIAFNTGTLTGQAKIIDDRITALDNQQIALLNQRDAILNNPPISLEDRLRLIAINAEIARIDGLIANEKVLLAAAYADDHNATITDLNAQIAALPIIPADVFAIRRQELLDEIQLREDLFAVGQTEPYVLDLLVDMSNDPSQGIRNSVDRILDGSVDLMTFSELEVPLSQALAFDPTFDPTTQIAMFRPPDNNIWISSANAGGWFIGDGNILIRDDQGSVVLVHEVNHALNQDNNDIFIGDHKGDDARAIRSFTTEMRAYDVDNRYHDDTDRALAAISSAPVGTSADDVILRRLGYDPANLTGNEVFIADHVSAITAGLPADLSLITPEQHAQIERLFIADLMLVDSTLYTTAADGYGNTESVRDVMNDIMTNGPGGNFDNAAPPKPEWWEFWKRLGL